METQEITLKARLITASIDLMGYYNYVFEDMDAVNPDQKYIMCVRFPNWNQARFQYNEIGFVTVKYVREGVDEWYDGKNMNKYRYTNIVFLKFVPLPQVEPTSEILLD